MMFAVIKTGGKQYRVAPGDTIFVEKLLGSSGDTITLSDVLMVNNEDKIDFGLPFVSGASVQATIREQTRGDKIKVFKKKRRQGYQRTKGHRQHFTVLKINAINLNGVLTSGTDNQVTGFSSSSENVPKSKDLYESSNEAMQSPMTAHTISDQILSSDNADLSKNSKKKTVKKPLVENEINESIVETMTVPQATSDNVVPAKVKAKKALTTALIDNDSQGDVEKPKAKIKTKVKSESEE